MLVSAEVVSVPDAALVPVHDPDAVQLVASVALHVNVDVAPLATFDGDAPNESVGAGTVAACCNVTVAVAELVPPAPLHANEKFEFEVNGPTVCVPLEAFDPDHAPDAAHVSASVADHVSVAVSPLATVVGFAVNEMTGTRDPEGVKTTCTVVEAVVVPPEPTHWSVYVWVDLSGPVL